MDNVGFGACQVNVVLDVRMMGEELLSFHPLTNEASTVVSWAGLTRWIEATGHDYTVVDFCSGHVVPTKAL